MPIYEYQCESCRSITEALQGISDEPLNTCPECSGKMSKLISQSSFHLKGGGWYSDGYSSTDKEKPSSTKPETSASCPKKDSCASCC